MRTKVLCLIATLACFYISAGQNPVTDGSEWSVTNILVDKAYYKFSTPYFQTNTSNHSYYNDKITQMDLDGSTPTDKLVLNAQIVQVNIHAISTQERTTNQIENLKVNYYVDTSALSNGMYFVNIYDNTTKTLSTNKLMVNR